MATTIDSYLAFRHDLRATLRGASPSALRSLLATRTDPRDAELRRLASLPDHALERLMRCMILAEPRLADLHGSARLWLDEHPAAPLPPAMRNIAPTDRRRRPARRPTWLSPGAPTPA
jgi:hypothetical protein